MSVIMRSGREPNLGSLSGRHQKPDFGSWSLEARIRAAVRRCIADEIEHLVNVLDALDADPDLEASADAEPSLGWTKTMAWGTTDDREEGEAVLFDET